MENPRYWKLGTQVLVLAAVPLVISAAWFSFQLTRNRTLAQAAFAAAPLAAAVIGLMTLIVTAINLAGNWQRQRREATIKAWVEWSNGTSDHRRTLTECFGYRTLTDEQAKRLVDYPDLEEPDRKAFEAMRATLNGLERIAVGVELGVYDLRTLSRLGGTIIVRQFDRTEPYIELRRRAPDPGRQAKAYVSLEYICVLLRSGQLQDQARQIDQRRLNYLRRGSGR